MVDSIESRAKSFPFGIPKSRLLALYHSVGEVMSALSVNFAPKFTCPRPPPHPYSCLRASSVSPAIPRTNSPDPVPFPDSSHPTPPTPETQLTDGYTLEVVLFKK